MSCDQNMIFPFGPTVQPLLDFLLFRIIFCGACGIQDTVMFQRSPQIPDQEAGAAPESGIQEIGLMPVGEIDISRVGSRYVFQNDSRIKSDIRQKRTAFQVGIISAAAGVGVAVFYGIAQTLLYHIMISIKHVETALGMEAGK